MERRAIWYFVGFIVLVVAFWVSSELSSFYITLGAFLTLSILSFLYKDNIFYKAAEHLFVGVSAAYWMVMGFWSVLIPNLIGRIHPPLVRPFIPAVADQPPSYWYFIPAVLGIMLLMRLSPKGPWISRWALAFIVGTTAGLNFIRYMASDLLGQINSSMIPLIVIQNGGLDTLTTISNIVIFLGFPGCVLRADLLLLLKGAQRCLRFRFEGRDMDSHGDLRRRFWLYGDGTYIASGWAIPVPSGRLVGAVRISGLRNLQ
jgi:hypothetical protein